MYLSPTEVVFRIAHYNEHNLSHTMVQYQLFIKTKFYCITFEY